MKFSEISETIKLSLDSMKSNKLRSSLAALGVVIGISFVILTGWIIGGLDKALEDTINLMGQDMLYIDKWNWAGGKNWKEEISRKEITIRQAEEFCDRITLAELSVPLARRWNTTIKSGNESYEGIITMGTKAIYASTPSGSISEGRFFSEFEDAIGTNVVVLGKKVAETLFPNSDPIDQIISLEGRKFQVIGIVVKQSTMLMEFIDNQIYIPLNSFMSIFGGQYSRSINIAIKVGKIENMDNVREESRGLMREIRNLKPYDEDDFAINETKAFEETVADLRMYVWSIGIGLTLLSFIVGIIGIMNIMFVSVTERTKEIGIRKAIGAKKSSILLQFIVESSSLCFLGAIISFIGCSILIFLGATFLPKIWPGANFLQPIMPVPFLLWGSIVSILVGVLAGLIPAFKAANLDPVDALRFE